MRTQVAIIGGGPSGLLLSQLLNKAGIETVILERQSREYVLSRIRAGVLEYGAVDMLRKSGAGERMDREGMPHDGVYLTDNGKLFRIDFVERCGERVMVYGQTEFTRDLYKAQDDMGAIIIDRAANVALHDLDTDRPYVTWEKDGTGHRLDCDFVAGCDGFHGVSRPSIPDSVRKDFERIYPFGWLGIMSETPPAAEEIVYARNRSGFALASMRTRTLSRSYIQVPLTDRTEDWSDEAFWEEFKRRMAPEIAETLVTGPSIEKSIAPLRSFVSEPMRWGRLFLCGDAAHIVPPTGAKGLNLAASDVHYLYEGLKLHYLDRDDSGLDQYSQTALKRIWQAMRFSWSMTMLLHTFPEASEFDRQMQSSELVYLADSENAQKVLAEKYIGLPF